MVLGTKLSKLLKFQPGHLLEMGKTAISPEFSFKSIHTTPILCIDFDAAGYLLASGDAAGQLAVWNIHNGDLVARKKRAHDKGVTCLKTLGGFHIVTAGFDKMIRLYKLEKSFESQESSNSVDSVADPHPQKTKKSSLWKRLFKKKTQQPSSRLTLVKEFRGHKGEIYCMELVCKKTMFATGATDNLINVSKIVFIVLIVVHLFIAASHTLLDLRHKKRRVQKDLKRPYRYHYLLCV